MKRLVFNTSNQGKQGEYERLLGQYGYGLTFTNFDLSEIEGTPEEVVTRKAVDAQGSWVEDTSLFVEGFPEAGVNIRFVQDHLNEVLGARARFLVLLAKNYIDDVDISFNDGATYTLTGNVLIYKGEVYGTIKKASGKGGFGFDPYFYPDGSTQSLAHHKPNHHNPRAIAVQNLVSGNFYSITNPESVINWQGKWQNH